ncbi:MULTISPECIES: DUF1127 domain-containing protein [unclassified Mesorhizobium]|uniref:DUF1127 domain-containing protein n=1 Tax=unclassified Mesorhizobium TaxID=325217 RepID=UPI0003CE7756|nr:MULTISPECIES: DUF1127 domain-containing protein [unclassified Mesorhizobium]ESY51224.1 hypothetical protein X745_23230 [Mesorhizobium sp. LNJC374B00]ESY56820.1 hypothetical protein X744_21760 [Mesorhizobium sp. LNJC372A00]WJI82122.1 DUF1127 domain-containing protein [Mesorhizobium sp. C374B]WJI88641.1 DUF1127 domain-containing protein [Mesorhizobium sp. C372A]
MSGGIKENADANRFRPTRQPPAFSIRHLAQRRLLARWYDRHLQRLDLAEVDDHLLRDLGLTREDVRRECAKSFWQA